MRSMIMAFAALGMSALAVAQDKPGRKLELYDVRDLMDANPDFPAVDLSLAVDAVTSSGSVGDRGKPVDALVPAARALLTPLSSLEMKDTLLVVRATEEEHRSVKELLSLVRRRWGTMVSLEAQFLQTAVDLRDGKPGSLSLLPEKEAQDLLRKATDAEGKMLTAPRLTTFNGQQGSFFIGDQLAYVQDFHVTVDQAGVLRADPVVAVARRGIALSVRPVLMNAEKEEILLEDLQVSLAEFRRPKAQQIETPYGAVEDPELQTLKVTLHATAQAGQVVLVGPLSKPWSKKQDPKVWILLRHRLIPSPAK